MSMDIQKCPRCQGSCRYNKATCAACEGEGTLDAASSVFDREGFCVVTFPSGYQELSDPNGDYICRLTEPEDRTFSRDLDEAIQYMIDLSNEIKSLSDENEQLKSRLGYQQKLVEELRP